MNAKKHSLTCLANTLFNQKKYLISGLSGWLGRALVLELTENFGVCESDVLGIGSSARKVIIGGQSYQIATWDQLTEYEVCPILFAHFGFLTRDKIAELPRKKYIELNAEISNQAFETILKFKPKSIISVSSGAVYKSPNFEELDDDLSDNPYGVLKQSEERMLQQAAESIGSSFVINRLFGLTGKNIQNIKPYALAEFINCALKNHPIQIRADRLVYRRYVYDRDLCKLMIKLAQSSESHIFDSGGEIVELRDLAMRVVKVLNSKSEIYSSKITSEPDTYYSPNNIYEKLFSSHVNSLPTPLDQQIQNTAEGLRALKPEGEIS